jgi:hypothetical protein
MSMLSKLAFGLALLVGVGAASAARVAEAVPGPAQTLTLRLHCGTHEVHWWQRSTNLADWTTFQRSATGGSSRVLSVALTNFSATGHYFRTLQTNEPLFAYGLAAREFIDLNGNNLSADSFDSSNPAFSTDGRWEVTKRRDGANLSVGTTLSNAPLPDYTAHLTVWGNCYLQSTGAVSVGSLGKIGNPAWQIGGAAGIQPGHLIQDWPVVHPEVVLPAGCFQSKVFPEPDGGLLFSDRRTLRANQRHRAEYPLARGRQHPFERPGRHRFRLQQRLDHAIHERPVRAVDRARHRQRLPAHELRLFRHGLERLARGRRQWRDHRSLLRALRRRHAVQRWKR